MHFGLMSNMAADRRDTTLSLTINLTQAMFTVASSPSSLFILSWLLRIISGMHFG